MDFLNDDWKPISDGGKIPNDLWDIIKHQPQNLLIFINPPYAEAGNLKVMTNTGKAKNDISFTKLKNEVMNEYCELNVPSERFIYPILLPYLQRNKRMYPWMFFNFEKHPRI